MTAQTPITSSEQQKIERWVLIATILASSIVSISSSALNVALPALQRDLNVTGAELLWIINAFALFLSALILVGGSLGDHYGRNFIFRIGIIVFTIASALCGLAPNTLTLIIARAIQGIGGAMLVPGSLAILTAIYPAARRGAAIGLWSTFSALMVAIGPVVGGWLAGQGLWRYVFYLNIPLAGVALFALSFVPETKDENASAQLDWWGALFTTLGLAGITYGFIQAPDLGFGHWQIIATLGGGFLSLILFVIVESRTPHPMVPLQLFRSRTFSGTNLLTLFLYAGLGGILFFLPLNYIQAQDYPEEIAGLTMLPFIVLLILMSRWAGGLVDRVGARLPLIVGPALAGVGMALFTIPGLTSGPAEYWTTFLPPTILFGIGMGITVAPLTTAVMGSAPVETTGIASGINNAVSRSAQVLAVAIFGAIALISFSQTLQTRLMPIELTDTQSRFLENESRNLGGAALPDDIDDETAVLVQQAIRQSFVAVFRQIMWIGAGLSWLSAMAAALLIEGKSQSSSVNRSNTV
ncbi:MAG: MFS transporter [Chloroflexota bacterium]